MHANIRLILVSAVLVLLSACAGTREMTSTTPAVKKPMTAEQEYINYVERVAKRRGIHLTWVNPPQLDDKATQQ